jgi:hypothetical protein
MNVEENDMTKMTQKEAVYQAVIKVCSLADGAYIPTKEERASINQILFEGFKSEMIALDEAKTDSELKGYVSGLQSNWLRKDKRLNGNVTYVAKNPGSRAGSTDPQIKAMRALLATKTDLSEREEIQAFIDKRVSEVKPTKTVTINVDDLPEELRHLIGE